MQSTLKQFRKKITHKTHETEKDPVNKHAKER